MAVVEGRGEDSARRRERLGTALAISLQSVLEQDTSQQAIVW